MTKMPLIECSLCARLFHILDPHPNPIRKIFLSPHYRGRNKLIVKQLTPSHKPENTQDSVIHASFPLKYQTILRRAPSLNNGSFYQLDTSGWVSWHHTSLCQQPVSSLTLQTLALSSGKDKWPTHSPCGHPSSVASRPGEKHWLNLSVFKIILQLKFSRRLHFGRKVL